MITGCGSLRRRSDGYAGIADPPEIKIEVADGLLPPATHEDVEKLREYKFTIVNRGKVALQRIAMKVQFPEWVMFSPSVSGDWPKSVPPGMTIEPIRPDPELLQVSSDVRMVAKPIPMDRDQSYPAFKIEIDELRPGRPIEFFVRSENRGLSFVVFHKDGTESQLGYHIVGSYQFEQRSKLVDRVFLIPLTYERSSRVVSARETQTNIKTMPPIMTWGTAAHWSLRPKTTADSGIPQIADEVSKDSSGQTTHPRPR